MVCGKRLFFSPPKSRDIHGAIVAYLSMWKYSLSIRPETENSLSCQLCHSHSHPSVVPYLLYFGFSLIHLFCTVCSCLYLLGKQGERLLQSYRFNVAIRHLLSNCIWELKEFPLHQGMAHFWQPYGNPQCPCQMVTVNVLVFDGKLSCGWIK